MAFPNFMVIGAAKAGTTALYWYLAEHPDVFMSPVKETNFFAYDRDEQGNLCYGNPELHTFPIRSMSAYEGLFEDVRGASAVGEASPIYLECPYAAKRIHAHIPQAKIICGLRDPVDRAYSDYLMYLRGQGRPFDPDRELVSTAEWAQPDSHWMRVSRYHDALARYFRQFPRGQIQVFLFDDLKRNPCGVAQDAYRFLGVDANHQPDVDTPYNVGGIPSNLLLERAFTVAASVRRNIEPVLPRPAMNWLRRLRASNMQKAPRLPAGLKLELMEHFRDDVLRTSELIERDLSGWLEPRPGGHATNATQGRDASARPSASAQGR